MNWKYISVLKLTLVEMGTNKSKSSELKKVDNTEGGLMWSRQTQNDKINWTDSLFAGIMPIGIREIDHIDNR